MSKNTWRIYEWANGGQAFLTMRHPSEALVTVEMDEPSLGSPDRKIKAEISIQKSNGSGRMVGIEARRAFDQRLHPMVRGMLEDFNPPDRSGSEEANYSNFWIWVRRDFSKPNSVAASYLQNPRFVPDQELTMEFVSSRILIDQKFSIHGLDFRIEKRGGDILVDYFDVWGARRSRIFLPFETFEKSKERACDNILRELEYRNVKPMSEMEAWRRENVLFGTPLVPSREVIDLFKAMGEPNPLWWDNEPSIEFFRSSQE